GPGGHPRRPAGTSAPGTGRCRAGRPRDAPPGGRDRHRGRPDAAARHLGPADAAATLRADRARAERPHPRRARPGRAGARRRGGGARGNRAPGERVAGSARGMTERAAGAAYRGVMQLLARVAEVASRAPAALPRWRALGDRLGRLEAANGRGPTLWVHAAPLGGLRAGRPPPAPPPARRPGRPAVAGTPSRTR